MKAPGGLYRLSAFTKDPAGGNPAGVWIGDALPEASEMQAIASKVGFSETIFIAPATGTARTVRYFSPEAEVPFCGHATIAAGIQLGMLDGEGEYYFETSVGAVPVLVHATGVTLEASLTSVMPRHLLASAALIEAVLLTLDWEPGDLDPAITPVVAFAGAWHLILAAATPERLNRLNYDFETLKTLMLAAELTTVQLIWRESDRVYHARNPFPVGGVVEDPATGAAAAALGGYLRDAALIVPPADITIRQGEAMGRPSELRVHIPSEGGIVVTGYAVSLP